MNTPFKIVAIVKMNGSFSVVLNRKPEYLYQREGNFLYAQDGIFLNSFYFEKPSGRFKAFAGREFELKMIDGTFIKCEGQWWDGGHKFVSDKLGIETVSIGWNTVDELKKCYVFYGGSSVDKEGFNKLLEEYTGETYGYWDYEKVIKYDDVRSELWNKISTLEKEKRHVIKQCKELSNKLKTVKEVLYK